MHPYNQMSPPSYYQAPQEYPPMDERFIGGPIGPLGAGLLGFGLGFLGGELIDRPPFYYPPYPPYYGPPYGPPFPPGPPFGPPFYGPY
ncbi:hypothetical protein [Gracilibacillus alcaliphilus]|uniref:hypothetical protein n=1 Tax=Gracilibacillus alcaliphilus TaxID=1401441 RepID=UPI001EF8180D|nr:hypothetical protein [Gracilibacillus alcaliphilus]MBM7679310.1 hypothetical protein [Gracilibacillus alcaliphilus]